MKVPSISKALAILLGAASMAGAVHSGVISGTGSAPSSTQLGATDAVRFKVAEGETGHALMVPYFTAQKGQMTVLHLVNTDSENGKVVKVRFRGANNGDSLLSVHVLLSPGDMWTAAVTAGADGIAQLTTGDRTCTRPELIRDTPQPFSTDRLDPAWPTDTRASNTREGSIEAIVVADVPQARVYGADGASNSTVFTAIKQVNGTAPCNLFYSPVRRPFDEALLSDIGSEATAAGLGFATPTGQVAATWYIIDVPGATTFTGTATAIQAVNNAGLSARGNYMLFPPTDEDVAQPERYTADPLLVSAGLAFRGKDAQGNTSQPTTAPVLTARFNDLPDLSTPVYLPATAQNARATAGDLSSLLAVKDLKNQYAADSSISARTDWVIAMPTKRYSVAQDYSQSDKSNQRVYSVVSVPGTGNQYFHSANTELRKLGICSKYFTWRIRYLDRESSSGIQPGQFYPFGLESCGAVSVLTLGLGGALSSSVNPTPYTAVFTNGWANVLLPDADGLPIIGASFIKLTNPNATPGMVGNYGLTYPYIKNPR